MIEIKNWVEFTKQYPPAEIFFGSNKEKQERKCKAQCEVLFTFEPTDSNHPAAKLRKMWSTWRDLEVLLILGIQDMKSEVVYQHFEDFRSAAKEAIEEMEKAYKPDQAIWNYYKSKSMSLKMLTGLLSVEKIKAKNVHS